MINGNATLVGNVVSEPKQSVSLNGNDLARFRMVVQPRKFDQASGVWVDGTPSYYTVITRKGLAFNVLESLRVGDPIFVSGTIQVREWESGDQRRSSTEIYANSIGHDLCRGVSMFRHVNRTVRPKQQSANASVSDATVAA
ncbi:MAG: single-stranded DNA-binding protein [Candidatus Nanopelagicales bacterium]